MSKALYSTSPSSPRKSGRKLRPLLMKSRVPTVPFEIILKDLIKFLQWITINWHFFGSLLNVAGGFLWNYSILNEYNTLGSDLVRNEQYKNFDILFLPKTYSYRSENRWMCMPVLTSWSELYIYKKQVHQLFTSTCLVHHQCWWFFPGAFQTVSGRLCHKLNRNRVMLNKNVVVL
jgi:hypothetical protein